MWYICGNTEGLVSLVTYLVTISTCWHGCGCTIGTVHHEVVTRLSPPPLLCVKKVKGAEKLVEWGSHLKSRSLLLRLFHRVVFATCISFLK